MKQLHFTQRHVGLFIVLTVIGSFIGYVILRIGWVQIWDLLKPMLVLAFVFALLITGLRLMLAEPQKEDPKP